MSGCNGGRREMALFFKKTVLFLREDVKMIR